MALGCTRPWSCSIMPTEMVASIELWCVWRGKWLFDRVSNIGLKVTPVALVPYVRDYEIGW